MSASGGAVGDPLALHHRHNNRGETWPITPEQTDLERLFRSLKLVRGIEERTAEAYPSDRIKCPMQFCIGQEALAVGVCDLLRRDDIVAMPHRGHAAYLAKGGSPRAMIAELYGKAKGCARGAGGSLHLVALDVGVVDASAVVGTQVPLALGWGLAIKRRWGDQVVACFFGEGATEKGSISESVKFATLHRLLILFVFESNG